MQAVLGRARHGVPAVLAAGLAGLMITGAAAPAAASAPAAATPGKTVLAWGSNFYGELGNGTTTDSNKPVAVKLPASLRYTTVRSELFSLAVSTSGKVFAWGNNAEGQLGDGTTTGRLKPVRVRLPAGVKVKTAREGALFTLALTTAGKLLAWGYNSSGQLGNGSVKSRHLPVSVQLPRGVTITAISAGDDSALALTSTGRVLSWGGNGAGQLGNGTSRARHVPGYVKLPAHTKITSIAAGQETGYAVTSAGRLLAWGLNAAGELGDGTTKVRKTPVQVKLPKGVKVAAAAAGFMHALALTAGGRVLAWGYNAFGQLGNGATTDRHRPVWVKFPAATRIRALIAGRYFSMALTTGHRILTWGLNDLGQLGNGSNTNSATPVRVHLPAGFTPTAIGAGWDTHTGLAIGHQIRD